MTGYDSREDTQKHINRVASLLMQVVDNVRHRAVVHDASKLESPEVEAFDVLTPRLKDLTYGSDDYRACLREMKPALDHHYAANSHHPEHYKDGVDGMSLFDLLEMLMDWKAAGERHTTGDIRASIAINTDRFEITPQLVSILTHTVDEMGW